MPEREVTLSRAIAGETCCVIATTPLVSWLPMRSVTTWLTGTFSTTDRPGLERPTPVVTVRIPRVATAPRRPATAATLHTRTGFRAAAGPAGRGFPSSDGCRQRRSSWGNGSPYDRASSSSPSSRGIGANDSDGGVTWGRGQPWRLPWRDAPPALGRDVGGAQR